MTSQSAKEQKTNPYPANDLGVIYEHLVRLLNETSDRRFSGRTALLYALGFADGSGAGNYVVSSLMQYGLLARGQTSYSITDLALNFASPTLSAEAWKDLATQVISSPELYKRLFARFGYDKLPSNIELILTKGYKVKGSVVTKVIRNYSKSIDFIQSRTHNTEQSATPATSGVSTTDKEETSTIEVDFGDGLKISVPKRLILEAYLNELQKKGWIKQS